MFLSNPIVMADKRRRGLTHSLAGFFLLLGLAATSWAQPPAQRGITVVTGDLYRAHNNMHATVFLVTEAGIILADPINREFAEWLKAQLAERFKLPVKFVLYSHHHEDHVSGGQVFADTAQFVGQENMLAHMAGPGAASDDPMRSVHPPTLSFSEKYQIELGGSRVEMMWMGDITHTDNMSTIYFPDQKAVFVVDFINLKALPSPRRSLGRPVDSEAEQFEAWIEAIQSVEALDFDFAVAGHGPVSDKATIVDFRRYLEQLRDGVSAGIAQGNNLAEIQASLVLQDYQGWMGYPAWKEENIAGMYEILTGRQLPWTPQELGASLRRAKPQRD